VVSTSLQGVRWRRLTASSSASRGSQGEKCISDPRVPFGHPGLRSVAPAGAADTTLLLFPKGLTRGHAAGIAESS